ncbi:hypothetical protein ACB098_07G002300 [Castanea mollissima]
MSFIGGSMKGGRGKPKSLKSVSQSQKVGLQFPVGHIARFLKAGKYAERVGARTLIYLFAVLEYLDTDIKSKLENLASKEDLRNEIRKIPKTDASVLEEKIGKSTSKEDLKNLPREHYDSEPRLINAHALRSSRMS